MKRADAARILRLDRATITRVVKANPSLLDEDGLVNPDEIRALRSAVTNSALATRKGGRMQDPAAASLNDTRQRTESAKATAAELDLADRLGLTLQRADVERQIMAAGQEFNQACGHLARDRAEALALISDVREMERALDELTNHLREQLAQALTLAAASPGSSQSS